MEFNKIKQNFFCLFESDARLASTEQGREKLLRGYIEIAFFSVSIKKNGSSCTT